MGYLVLVSQSADSCSRAKSYLFFWDKLNKANYYLELSIENADKSLDDRLVYFLSNDLISDGGQWDMVVNVLEVPYPTTRYSFKAYSHLLSSNTELFPKPYTLNPTHRPPPVF